MAHYAFIKNSIVQEVIVGRDEDDTDLLPEGFANWEEFYLSKKPQYDLCKRTSYNTASNTHLNGGTPFRGNFAGIGMTYDEVNDIFHETKVLENDSWVLNTTTAQLEPPIPMPNEGSYKWVDEVYKADNTKGWVAIT